MAFFNCRQKNFKTSLEGRPSWTKNSSCPTWNRTWKKKNLRSFISPHMENLKMSPRIRSCWRMTKNSPWIISENSWNYSNSAKSPSIFLRPCTVGLFSLNSQGNNRPRTASLTLPLLLKSIPLLVIPDRVYCGSILSSSSPQGVNGGPSEVNQNMDARQKIEYGVNGEDFPFTRSWLTKKIGPYTLSKTSPLIWPSRFPTSSGIPQTFPVIGFWSMNGLKIRIQSDTPCIWSDTILRLNQNLTSHLRHHQVW